MYLRIFQIISLLALSIYSLFIGVADISISSLLNDNSQQLNILLITRVPRLISILVAGTSLAIAGLIMQSITCNKFVSPATAGTMQWSKLGVMIAIICFPEASSFLRVFIAFIVSLFGTWIFLILVEKIQNRNIILVPLLGIMLGGVVSAIATFFGYQYDIIQNMSSWLQGNFSLIMQGNYELMYISIPFMIIAYFYSDLFTIANMGKSVTTTLGLNHKTIMRIGLFIISIITAISIVGVGYIPFVGLIVPNIVSILRGDSVKHTLFDTAYLGAMLVLICDILARVILFPYEIPIAIILSILGSITFLLLLTNRRSYA